MKYITLEQIKAHQPCAEQFRAARRLFGKRKQIAVTVEAAVAVADKFDFHWLAVNLLPPAALAEFLRVTAAARAEYQRATAAARAEYERAMAAARAKYQRVTAAAEAEFGRVRAAAETEFERVTAPARAEYQRARAVAFARAYI